jgi:beta-lactamase class A
VNRNKGLFSGRKSHYYSYRIGAYQSRKSIWRIILVPTSVMIILGVFSAGGYLYYQKSQIALSVKDALIETPKVEEITQEQIDQKSLQVREDPELVDAIKDKLESMPKSSTWSVSVRDLQSGRMANINSDELMTTASIYKLFLLAPLEKKISADNWKSVIGKMSINDCVMAMIQVSNNDCPQALGDYANWKTADTYNQSLGFKNTRLGIKDGQVTTAREVNDIMYRLQNSQILSDKARRLVFDALYEQKYRSGIPNGCGPDCLVANKTGEIDDVKHDAAIVTHGAAQYVLVIMTKNATWPQIAELSKMIDVEMLP